MLRKPANSPQKPPRQPVIRSHSRNGATLSSFVIKGSVPHTNRRA